MSAALATWETDRPIDTDPNGRLLTVAQLQRLVQQAGHDVRAALGPDVQPLAARRAGLAAAPVVPVGALCVYGPAGGSGETYLAAALTAAGHPSIPAGHVWPAQQPPTPVVICARTTVQSLTAAQRAAGQWASGAAPGAVVVGIAVLADAPGHTPRPLAEFINVLAGGVPAVWRIGWQPEWRVMTASELDPPRSLRRVLDQMAASTVAAMSSPKGVHQ